MIESVSMAPTLILLHGFTHTGASWEPVLASGGGQSYRSVAPDIRGHGTASAAVPITLKAVLADITALADGDVTLAGYSMGGRLALHVALALGPRVRRLVLVGASPGLADTAERAARRAADEALADEFEGLSIEQLADRWAQTPILARQPPGVAEAIRLDRLRNDPAALARALRGLGTGALPSLWDRLGELAMPAALVAGERDEKFASIAEQMAAAMPAAAVEIVPGAGHAAHLEAPAAVAAILAESP
jgi:2-succinyl-6-hydroxy-2,4-cyclohexadiene-1-carboxylate synthase